MGRGCNAIYSATGIDKSTILYLAPTLEEFLAQHYQTLSNDRFSLSNGEISEFRKNPAELFGSTTVTQGIKVEVQAFVHHFFCRFDKDVYEGAPKYFFVYQVRFTVM